MPSQSASTLSRASRLAFIVFLSAARVPTWALPGDIYVSRCCEVDEIDRVSPDGSVTTFATSGLNSASALAFDAAGNLFVTNSGNSTDRETHAQRGGRGLRQHGIEWSRRTRL